MTVNPAPSGDPTPAPLPAGDPPADPKLTPEQLQAQLEDTKRALKAANKEAADRRKQVEAFEKAEADRQAATLSETEKLQKAVAEAESRAQQATALANERLIRSDVIARAAALKFADPSDALTLIDRSKLVINDAGEVEGAETLLKDLAKAKPYLLGKAGPAPLATGNPGNGSEGETDVQKRARIYGAGGDFFNAEAGRANGGGVYFTPEINPKQQPT